jgi:hypothetical protein
LYIKLTSHVLLVCYPLEEEEIHEITILRTNFADPVTIFQIKLHSKCSSHCDRRTFPRQTRPADRKPRYLRTERRTRCCGALHNETWHQLTTRRGTTSVREFQRPDRDAVHPTIDQRRRYLHDATVRELYITMLYVAHTLVLLAIGKLYNFIKRCERTSNKEQTSSCAYNASCIDNSGFQLARQ